MSSSPILISMMSAYLKEDPIRLRAFSDWIYDLDSDIQNPLTRNAFCEILHERLTHIGLVSISFAEGMYDNVTV